MPERDIGLEILEGIREIKEFKRGEIKELSTRELKEPDSFDEIRAPMEEFPMSTKTLDQHIEITPDIAGGKPRIAGRRITVQNIAIWHEFMGMSADEIAADYGLSLGDIKAAMAYYFEHRQEIERQIAEDEAFVDVLQVQTPSPFRQRLIQDERK